MAGQRPLSGRPGEHDLLELAVELIADWSGETVSGATIRARAAWLLGTTTDVAAGRHRSSW